MGNLRFSMLLQKPISFLSASLVLVLIPFCFCLSIFRWLPVDVARIYGCNELVPVLKPNSNQTIPVFPTSCLSLPLISILKIARYY